MKSLKLSGQKAHNTDEQLRGLSAVLVDEDRVFIDNGAIHAKSSVEQGIAFIKDKDELSSPREIWCFWLTLQRGENGVQSFKAIQGFPMYIDKEAKQGYKVLADSVNKLDKVVKGQADVSNVPQEVLKKLKAFLESRKSMWEQAQPSFREAFRI